MSAIMHVAFDTLKYIETLKAAGITDEHAKAMIQAQKEFFTEAVDTSLATKSDISSVRDEIAEARNEIKEVKNELKSFKCEVKTEFSRVDTELKYIRWILGLLVAGIATLIFKAFF